MNICLHYIIIKVIAKLEKVLTKLGMECKFKEKKYEKCKNKVENKNNIAKYSGGFYSSNNYGYILCVNLGCPGLKKIQRLT